MKQKHTSVVSRWICVLVAFVLWSPSALATDRNPPELMTYQGYLTDGDGQPLGNSAPKNYDVVFSIWDALSDGNRLWTEQQTVTVDKGYFSVLLGEGAMYGSYARPQLSTLFADAATASDRFIEITVRGVGNPSADVVIKPRLRLLTSPYAFLAHNAVNAASLVNSGNSQIVSISANNVGINKLTPETALDVAGTVTASGLTINGTATLTHVVGQTTFDSDLGLTGNHVFEFGKNVSPKQADGGKIGYQKFSQGLDIVGAGNTSSMYSRKVTIWAEGGLTVQGPITNNSTIKATAFVGAGTIPAGGIILWSGAVNDIPTGWALCDGQNGTPNLTNRFVLAASTSVPKGTAGGSTSHILSVAEMPSHAHNIYHVTNSIHKPTNPSDDHYYIDQVQSAVSPYTWTTVNNGSGNSFSIMPPYYALAYIMRTQ